MTEYYVDNDVGGPGSGTEGDPWDDVASNVGTLGPNDRMNIRGDVGSPRLYLESPISCTNNGTSGSPISMRPYPGELIKLRTTPDAWNSTLIIGGDWWEFWDLGFDNNFQNGWQISVDTANHIRLMDCTLKKTGGTAAIRFALAGSSTDFIIDGVEIYDTFYQNDKDAHGIIISGTTTREVTIKNSNIYDCRGDCVHVYQGVGNVTIEDSDLYTTLGKCSENGLDGKMGTIIMRRCNLRGFRYCDGTCGGSGGGIGAAVIGHQNIVSLTVEDCIIRDCVSGVNISSNTAECAIQRNVLRDFVTDAATWLNAGIYIHASTGNTVYVYNNTFVELPSVLWRIDATGDAEFKNNLAYETHTITDNGGTLVYDYNGWFNVVDSLVGAHDTTGSDPGFRDAANDDYHPHRGSAVVNAGVDVGLDFVGSAPDLGAYEHRRPIVASSWR